MAEDLPIGGNRSLSILVLGDYFAFKTRNDYLVLLASAFYFIGMNLIISKWRRKYQQAKRQWKQEHG